MIKRHSPYIVIILVCFILSAFVTFSVAWFAEETLTPVGGEVMVGYFAGGNGTEEKPYVINRPIHLYNLAWLQNTGRFNGTNDNGEYTQFHFVISADLDMTGVTLPPIGTLEYPFIGTFKSLQPESAEEGAVSVKYTIENLTVSNVLGADEISKRPQQVTELVGAEVIGLFGVVGSCDLGEELGIEGVTYGSIVPSVSDFYLENITIRSQTESALMGLIAGYVNGKIHNVGVLGGTLISGDGNTQSIEESSISLYALIGNKSKDVNWGGVLDPHTGTGAITVDANDSDFKTAMDNVKDAQDAAEDADEEDPDIFSKVPDAAKDRAFVTGMDISIGSEGPKTAHFCTSLVKSTDTSARASTSNTISINTSKLTNGYLPSIGEGFTDNADFYTRFKTIANNTLSLGQIDFENLTTVTLEAGGTLDIPTNCVWFKPAGPGNCIISFLLTSKNQDGYKSIYKFRRENGNIVDVQEIELSFDRNIGNKAIVCFQYQITLGDVNNNYEYAIGSSSKHPQDTVKFYFLALAGASSSGSVVTDQSKELLQVNFIDEETKENNGNVAPNGAIITTFDVRLTSTTAGTETVSFTRDSMTEEAEETHSGAIFVDRYSYQAIVNSGSTQ